tara:strand:- start:98 stop:325 length:228 start_codon:yes stop_codon:yes gene_type:complete
MSDFNQEVSNSLVHIKIEPRPATDLVIMRLFDSSGDSLGVHLTDIDHLGNLSFDINTAIQDREIWLHEQEQNNAD